MNFFLCKIWHIGFDSLLEKMKNSYRTFYGAIFWTGPKNYDFETSCLNGMKNIIFIPILALSLLYTTDIIMPITRKNFYGKHAFWFTFSFLSAFNPLSQLLFRIQAGFFESMEPTECGVVLRAKHGCQVFKTRHSWSQSR